MTTIPRAAIVVATALLVWLTRDSAARAQPVRLPEPTQRNVIVQLFNWPFKDVEAALPRLREIGYSHVHVSPPQKSHGGDEWYFRYQPVDFTTIEGPLGDAAAFKRMNDKRTSTA